MARIADKVHALATTLRRPWAAKGFVVLTTNTSEASSDPVIRADAGAITDAEPNGSLHLRTDGPPRFRNGGTWTEFAIEGGNSDFAATVTATDELVNADLSVNEATAVGVGVDAQVIQLTTPRTGGSVAAFRGTTTSLAGDTGSPNYTSFLAAAPTDGGGTVVHVAFEQAAGYDVFADLSAAATGEADMVLGDNLASALQVREAANPYLTFVTTDGSEAIASAQRLTTTDGVASGTARVVGGRAHSTVAASTAITNTTTETLFDENYSIPANTLKAGTVIRYRAQGIATATNGTDTLQIRARIGGVAGTLLLATAAVDVADNDTFHLEGSITVRTAGASGTLVASGMHVLGVPGTATARNGFTASTAVDTTASQVLGVTAEWGAASTANSVRLDILEVSIA